MGDPYFRGRVEGRDATLVENRDPVYLEGTDPPDEYWFEAEAKDCTALLDVSGEAADGEALCRDISGKLGLDCRIIKV